MPSLRTHGFFPHWFQREAVPTYSLTSAEQQVFYALCGQVDSGGVAKASQRLISERTGLARSSVQTALKRLQLLHLIELSWPAGVKSSAQYAIPEHMPLPASKIPAPTRRDETQSRSRRTA